MGSVKRKGGLIFSQIVKKNKAGIQQRIWYSKKENITCFSTSPSYAILKEKLYSYSFMS